MAGGGGAAPAPKADDLVPHPVKDQLPNVSYCITSPPPWRQFCQLLLSLTSFFSTPLIYLLFGSCLPLRNKSIKLEFSTV